MRPTSPARSSAAIKPAFALILITPRIGPRQAFSTSSTGEGTCFGSTVLAPMRYQRAALMLAASFNQGDTFGHTIDDVVLTGEAVVHERVAAIATNREQHGNLAHALRHLQMLVHAIVEDAHRSQTVVAAHAVVEIELVNRRIGQRRVGTYAASDGSRRKGLLRILRIEKADPQHRIVVTGDECQIVGTSVGRHD